MRTSVMIAAVAASASLAGAQQTVWLDFAGGATGTPQGNITALTTAVFPGLPGGVTNGMLRTALATGIRADYAGLNINFVTAMPAAGPFLHAAIGNTATNPRGAFGVASEIDFRNKNQANIVSLAATPASNLAQQAGLAAFTLNQAVNLIRPIASHEIGHALGLVHSDVVSAFVGAGGGAAGQAAVQNNEIMTAVRLFNGAREVAPKTFGAYSRVKLRVATAGINVQPEMGAAVFTLPTAADPGRNGDAGATIATGRALAFDAASRTTVLGSLNNDVDMYTFAATAGQLVTAEVFSQILVDFDGAGTVFQGRIANPVNPVLAIVNAAGTVIQTQQFSTQSDFDGVTPTGAPSAADFGSDGLIYQFQIPANGMYGVRVMGATGGDGVGNYELFVAIPTPGTVPLILVGLGVSLRRRRGEA